MHKLVGASLAVLFAAVLQTDAGATNYHEYRKWGLACPTGTATCRCGGDSVRYSCCSGKQRCECRGSVARCR